MRLSFNETSYFAPPNEALDEYGRLASSEFFAQRSRIDFSAQKIVNKDGEEVVTNARIFLPAGSRVSIKHKFKFSEATDARTFDIQRIEYKKDVQGNQTQIIVYV